MIRKQKRKIEISGQLVYIYKHIKEIKNDKNLLFTDFCLFVYGPKDLSLSIFCKDTFLHFGYE